MVGWQRGMDFEAAGLRVVEPEEDPEVVVLAQSSYLQSLGELIRSKVTATSSDAARNSASPRRLPRRAARSWPPATCMRPCCERS